MAVRIITMTEDAVVTNMASRSSDTIAAIVRIIGIIGVPALLTLIGYSVGFAYFTGYFSYFHVDLHLLTFYPVDFALRSWPTYYVFYHAIVTLLGITEIQREVGSYLHVKTNSIYKPQPRWARIIEGIFAWLCFLAFMFNIYTCITNPDVTVVACVLGTLLGFIIYAAIHFQSIPLKIALLSLSLIAACVHAHRTGYVDASCRVRDKKLSRVEYRLLGSTEPVKSFFVTYNNGNYILLNYVSVGDDKSAIAIRVINEKSINYVEFQR
jgi:hypothetical protein